MLLSLVPVVAAVVAAAPAVPAAVVLAAAAVAVAAARQKPKQERIAQILSISTASSIKAQWAALVELAVVEVKVRLVAPVVLVVQADTVAELWFSGLQEFCSCQGVLMYLRQMVAETGRPARQLRPLRQEVLVIRVRSDKVR